VVFLILLTLILTFLWELVKRPERIARLMTWAKKKTGNRAFIVFLEKEILLFEKLE